MPINYRVIKGENKEQFRERIARETLEEQKLRREAMKNGELKVVMDVDDLGFLLPGFDDLLRLKKSLPNLKVTCFTIPLDKNFFNSENSKHFKWESYKKWADIINSKDWIEVAVHGFAHVHEECDISYDKAITLLEAVENTWGRIGLKYAKIIKAPYWQMSYDFMAACRDKGYVVAIDKNHIRQVPEGLETYIFNWSFEQPLPIEAKIIKGHGHFVGKNTNNIKDTLHNILVQIPKETEFMTIGEYLNSNGSDTKIIKRYYTKAEENGDDNSDSGGGDES